MVRSGPLGFYTPFTRPDTHIHAYTGTHACTYKHTLVYTHIHTYAHIYKHRRLSLDRKKKTLLPWPLCLELKFQPPFPK